MPCRSIAEEAAAIRSAIRSAVRSAIGPAIHSAARVAAPAGWLISARRPILRLRPGCRRPAQPQAGRIKIGTSDAVWGTFGPAVRPAGPVTLAELEEGRDVDDGDSEADRRAGAASRRGPGCPGTVDPQQ